MLCSIKSLIRKIINYLLIKFRMLAGHETGERACGFAFFGEKLMSKPFLTYEQQINLLVSKGLLINDTDFAISKLKQWGYFSLIGGYKKPFKNPSTRKYNKGTEFIEIYNLFVFDDELHNLFFKYICIVERNISNALAYAFCEKFGEKQNEYLDFNNYKASGSNSAEIAKLINVLDYKANKDNAHDYINHQRVKYNNVPLWILIHALTFGNLSKLYEYSIPSIRSKIARNYNGVSDMNLEKILKNLVLYRNVCGHNERLYSYKVFTDFPDTVIHKKMNIEKIGSQYKFGKKDLFGVVISLKYLLEKEQFVVFKNELAKLIDSFLKNNPNISKEWLYNEMGFPSNWENITRYKNS